MAVKCYRNGVFVQEWTESRKKTLDYPRIYHQSFTLCPNDIDATPGTITIAEHPRGVTDEASVTEVNIVELVPEDTDSW